MRTWRRDKINFEQWLECDIIKQNVDALSQKSLRRVMRVISTELLLWKRTDYILGPFTGGKSEIKNNNNKELNEVCIQYEISEAASAQKYRKLTSDQ